MVEQNKGNKDGLICPALGLPRWVFIHNPNGTSVCLTVFVRLTDATKQTDTGTQTDRQTDHSASVRIGRNYALRCGLTTVPVQARQSNHLRLTPVPASIVLIPARLRVTTHNISNARLATRANFT